MAGISAKADTALDLAVAMEIPSNSIVSATFTSLADADAAKVRSVWGVSTPLAGSTLAVLSSGRAADADDPGYVPPQTGSAFLNTVANPVAGQSTCGGTEAADVFDYTELEVVLAVPTNAVGFTFRFDFFSAEYPEDVCTQYNDRFMVRLTSQAFNGNLAFDSASNPVSVNTALFAVTSGGELVGTGMESGVGAATGVQSVQAAVTPGETITLKFSISDAGDHGVDSVAIMDAFDWVLGTNTPPPVTLTASIYPAVEIAWPTETNKSYQVEWTPQLAPDLWTNLGPVIPGTGMTNYMFDNTRSGASRFYRVRELP
jgi:hypothetical protein